MGRFGRSVLGNGFVPSQRKAHSKMRQSLIPRTWHTQLLRTVLRREFRDGMHILAGKFRTKKRGYRLKGSAGFEAAFDPHLVDSLFLPIRKKTHAVSARLDGVEVVDQFTEREIFIHVLLHQESRLNVERNFGNHTHCTETDDCPPETSRHHVASNTRAICRKL